MLFTLLVWLALSILGIESTDPRVDPLVLTNSGWVRGRQATDGDYAMFLGIPYAKVNPDNPFGNAIPFPKFDGVFDALDDSALCPQIFDNTIFGTLDCLNVNIYVPNTAHAVRLPVLLYVYGGSFEIGSANRNLYGPKYLVRHGVILVTFNYRLGPYGFMCLNIPEVPGNQGLKDQQLAFTWVKANIASFGGDPDKITVFGESGGAMSVDLHLTYKDFPFRNAVIQSGSAIHPSLLEDSDPEVPLKIAEHIGMTPRNVYEALHILAMLPPATLIDAAYKIEVSYRPCIEKRFHGIDNFMSVYPVNVDISKVNGMNILVGTNSDERLRYFPIKDEHFYETWDVINEQLKSEFVFEEMELQDKLVEVIRQFYIGDADITELMKRDLCNYESDWFFHHPARRAINKYLRSGVQKVYFYMFSYSGQRNFAKRKFNITEGGAAHSDEIGYLFDIQWDFITEPPTPKDQLILDRMTAMWTNFAKYDDPTPELSRLLPVKWEPISSNFYRDYITIDENLTMSYNPLEIRMRFWDIFYEEYGKYQKGLNKAV